MKHSRLVFVVLPLAIILAAVSFAKDAGVAAAQAATGLHISNQHCTPGGLVNARLNWTPSTHGQQTIDLSARSDFQPASTGGPFPAAQSIVDFHSMQPGTTYWTRVNTHTAAGIVRSAPLAFTTITCAPPVAQQITPPTNVFVSALSPSSILVQWNPGVGNIWFCVNTALSVHDLTFGGPTWRNHGCWTTANSLQIHGLQCGTTYHVNVFTWNHTSSATSHMASGSTAPCPVAITPPHNLRVHDVTQTSARFVWDRGLNNIWFCLNIARSFHDLAVGGPSWFNFGCWSTANSMTVHGLACGTTYHWNVFTWNHVASTTSHATSFTTAACAPRIEQRRAPIDEARIVRVGDRFELRLVVGLPDACHSPGGHDVNRVTHNRVDVRVWNDVEIRDVCAQVYSQYDLRVNLGTNFNANERYEVRINDLVCVFGFRPGEDPQWAAGQDARCV